MHSVAHSFWIEEALAAWSGVFKQQCVTGAACSSSSLMVAACVF